MDTLLTTVLTSTLFLSTSFAAPAATSQDVALTRVLQDKDYVGYVVQKEDSLANIATQMYGSDEYWTTLWNDNSWVTDPEVVAKDAVLKVRVTKPDEPAELASVLANRNTTVIEQKNDAYLKQIGYIQAITVQPTVVPTQAVPKATDAKSPISEEAITYLGNCEAGNDPTKNTGNGYYGAFQFSHGTWKRMNTGYERADLAPLEVQKTAVKQLLSQSSIYNQFPGCAKKMRSAGLI